MLKRISSLYDRRVSPLPLALFRIAFAAVLLIELGQMFYFRRLLFDPMPYVTESFIPPGPLLLIWMSVVVCLLIGYRTRQAAFLHYILAVIVLGYGAAVQGRDWQSDSLVLTASLLLLWLPAGRMLSVDRLLERRRYARDRVQDPGPEPARELHTVLLVLVIGLFYFDSALFKLSSAMYLRGLGVWAPASLPINSYWDATWLLNQKWLVQLMSYAVLALETFFLFLYPIRRLRLPLLLTGMLFHIGVMFILPIPVISLVTLSLYLGVLPASLYQRWSMLWQAARPGLTVYYDRQCPLCRQTMAVLQAVDLREGAVWKPLQEHAAGEPLLSGIPEEELLHDIYAVDGRRRIHRGIDTYIAVFESSGWLAPFGWLLRLPPLHFLASRVYSAVAERRAREGGCRDGVCSLRPPAAAVSPEPEFVRSEPRWHRYALSLLLALWLVSTCIILLAGPFLRTYVTGDSRLTAALHSVGEWYQAQVYPWTGWRSHDVFMDEHYTGYSFQTKLVYEQGGQQILLPTVQSGEGLTGSYSVGRIWEMWTFDSVRPGIDTAQAEKGILRYAAFWAMRNNADLERGTIRVLQRPLEVSLYEWKPDHLRSQLEQPWSEAAVIRGRPGEMRIEYVQQVRPERWAYLGERQTARSAASTGEE